jgi:hypothetical protein
VVVDDSCFGVWDYDAVAVDTEHESRALFASIFGVNAPEIGAHAKACAGASQSPGELDALPFETDLTSLCFTSQQPDIGQDCIIDFGAQGAGGPARGPVDIHGVPPGFCSNGQGSANMDEMIATGALGTCQINQGTPPTCSGGNNGPWVDCVDIQSGNQTGPIRSGLACRIRGVGNGCPVAGEGLCAALPGGNGDIIDDFSESTILVFDGPGIAQDIYEPRDCDPSTEGMQISPRIGTIFVIPQNPNVGGNTQPIVGFLAIYIKGCTNHSNNVPPGETPGQTAAQILAERRCDVGGGQGHIALWSTLLRLTTSGGGEVIAPSPGNTLVGIGLVE